MRKTKEFSGLSRVRSVSPAKTRARAAGTPARCSRRIHCRMGA